MFKRILDIVLAIFGILLISPILITVALLIKLSSAGPCIFGHERAGLHGSRFHVYKFRTMVQDASSLGGPLTLGGNDPRITTIGRGLRRTKLDELPQLFNVLFGQMSFVGPRPEAWKYVEMFPTDFAEILQVRPGITDPASIQFRDEGSLLMNALDPELEYRTKILPEKIRLAKNYIRNRSTFKDIKIVAQTIVRLFADRLN